MENEYNAHISEALDFLEKAQRGEHTAYSFGWGQRVDQTIVGLEREHLTVVGGSNKSGKSIHSLNTVYHNIRAGYKVLYVPTEMSAKNIIIRLGCRKLGILLRNTKVRGGLSPDEVYELNKEIMRLNKAPLVVLDETYPTYELVERYVEKHSPEIVVIDHFQRMNPENDNTAMGYRDLAQRLKHLAVAYHVPVLVMSQVNYKEGWCERLEDGTFQYTFQLMGTRWTNELHGEADKVLYLHNVGRDFPDLRGVGHVIYHSIRDYDADGYSAVRLDYNKLLVTDLEDDEEVPA